MALINLTFYSNALGSSTDITVMIPTPYAIDPEEADGSYFKEGVRFPVLYLLHGTYADHRDWSRWSSIERYAQKAKLAVVCPSGANSFWQDMYAGPQYFTFLTQELPKFLSVLLPISTAREDTYIGGLSMGGIGALNIALRAPEKYDAVACLSGGMFLQPIPEDDVLAHHDAWPWKAILPPPHDGVGTGIDDKPILRALAESKQPIPRIYMATGTEDFIYGKTLATCQYMDELGVPYTFETGPGVHDWVFWDHYIQRAIDWFHVRKP